MEVNERDERNEEECDTAEGENEGESEGKEERDKDSGEKAG